MQKVFLLNKRKILILILINIFYNCSLAQNNNCGKAEVFNKKSYELKDNDRELSLKNAFLALDIAEKFNCKEQQAEALRLIGIQLMYDGELDSARKYFYKSLSIFNILKNNKGIASCYVNIGNIYQYEGNYNLSINYYDKTIEKAKEVNNQELISAAENNKGNVFFHKGFYNKAVEHYKKSLEIDKSLKDDDGVISCLINLGSVYDMLGEYTLALSYYYQALQLGKKVNNLYKQGKIYNNIGKVFLSSKNYKLAYDYLNTALITREDINDKAGMIITLFNFAQLFHELKLYKKEASINQQALKLAEEINDLQVISVCLHNIGVNLSKRESNIAKTYFKESLKLADSIEAYPEQYNNLLELIPIYYNERNYKEAEECFHRLKYLHDSVLQVDKLGRKTVINATPQKTKSYCFISLSIAFIFLIIIVFSLYRYYKTKKIIDD
jgi:tetratricopeptide (TPR) repeat protein